MSQSRTAAGHAMGAARDLKGAARYAAYAAGQAAAVPHVAVLAAVLLLLCIVLVGFPGLALG